MVFALTFAIGKFKESFQYLDKELQERYTYIDDTCEFIGMKDVQEEEPQVSSGVVLFGSKVVPGAVTTKTVNYIYFKYGDSEIEVKDNTALSIKCEDLSKGDTLSCTVKVDTLNGTSKVVSIDRTEI